MKQFIHSRFPKTVGLVLALSVGMVACGTTSTPTVQPNVTVTLVGANSLPLVVGGTAKVNVTVTATGGASGDVTYTSSNTNVVRVDADGNITAVAPGTATITVASKTDTDADARAVLTVVVSAPPVDVKINFQRDDFDTPATFVKNIGAAFDATTGIGWVTEASAGTATPVGVNLTGNTRTRGITGVSPEQDTLIHMQYRGTNGNPVDGAFEHKLANGNYEVTVSVGDSAVGTPDAQYDSTHNVNVEGVNVINMFAPNATTAKFMVMTKIVEVKDNSLTIDAKGGTNTKINYVTIKTAP